MTKSREAIVAISRAMRDRTANRPPLPAIFLGASKHGRREVTARSLFRRVWRPWSGVRGKEEATHLLFAFLATAPNALVEPVHAAAMPVMLTAEQIDTWLDAPVDEALALARPFPAERMKIVLSGPRQDPGVGDEP